MVSIFSPGLMSVLIVTEQPLLLREANKAKEVYTQDLVILKQKSNFQHLS